MGPDHLAPLQDYAGEVVTAVENNWHLHDLLTQATAVSNGSRQSLHWNGPLLGHGVTVFPTSGAPGVLFYVRGIELYSDQPSRQFVAFVIGTVHSSPSPYPYPAIQPFVWDFAQGFVAAPLVRLTDGVGYLPALAQDHAGRFLAVWHDGKHLQARTFAYRDGGSFLTLDGPALALLTNSPVVTDTVGVEDLDVAMNGTRLFTVAWSSKGTGAWKLNVFRGYAPALPAGISQVKRVVPSAAPNEERTVRVAMLGTRSEVRPSQLPLHDGYALAYVTLDSALGPYRVQVEGRHQAADFGPRQVNDLNGEEADINTRPRIAGGADHYEVGWIYSDRLVGFIQDSGGTPEFLSRGVSANGRPYAFQSPILGGGPAHKCLNGVRRFEQTRGDLAIRAYRPGSNLLALAYYDYEGITPDVLPFPDPTPKFLGTKWFMNDYE